MLSLVSHCQTSCTLRRFITKQITWKQNLPQNIKKKIYTYIDNKHHTYKITSMCKCKRKKEMKEEKKHIENSK